MKQHMYIKITKELGFILVGSICVAIGSNTLLLPSHLLAGGLMGICMIIYQLTGLSVGVQYFLFNIPLLVLAYIHLGRKFVLYTVIAVICDSFFLTCYSY
ncbi:hypothetical protein A374_07449 [Fictibacillus macauensis ZFHKF-1]|uniref:YitT family protein n=1 Tax=Fictibacillus macauensis ZFHKF-1 TaxID=1196324 RepID=I8UFQ8_9BACL|nr:YitT family protein [Fictibacillus macauensis]EIT85653.1 hypothetical protein A374_07449 [Fictibacillus macauensis ZFHKF-1]